MFKYFIIVIIMIVCILWRPWIGKLNREMISSYECGFENEKVKRRYIQYYLIGVAYLLFDIETVILFPLVYASPLVNIWIPILFIIIIIIGLIYELNESDFF